LAISSGTPLRFSGTRTADIASRSSGSFVPGTTCPQIGVSMIPGCTELQRMPSPIIAHSSATDFVNSRTAPFDVQ
jgi:hypothetical protein